MDLIRCNLPPPTVKSQSPCDSGWSQAPVSSKSDEGVSDLVVDRIGVSTAIYREEPDYCNHGWSQAQVPASRGPDSENDNRQPLKCQFPREIGRSQTPRRQQGTVLKHPMDVLLLLSLCIDRSRCKNFKSSAAPQERDPDPPLRQQEITKSFFT
ncbi:hypothetical protein F511_29344 [Dorcoceras hygrometricum]|uniref:Uncharacterized protein n=1 Tax=Dorcoceras hygrometricum TaxID=472368 RepID=A0A2Z7ASP4_9LAMI|nr:hypothetical protein F511_29344 [Dorcoceras hygrometricum]